MQSASDIRAAINEWEPSWASLKEKVGRLTGTTLGT